MLEEEFLDEFNLLARGFPNSMPSDPGDRAITMALWYDHFNHIPKELFAKAAKSCREHERFLSIASLRESIMQVAGIPCAFEIRRQLYEFYENKAETIHPIGSRIHHALDLKWVGAEMTDFAFEREYARAREWYVEMIMKPENVALLTGPPLLEGGESKGA